MAAGADALFGTIKAAGPSRADSVARLDALARLLDSAVEIPGTRIRMGLDGLIGLVPFAGDAVSALLSSYIIWEARQLGLPRWKIARMIANVALDTAVGIVPILGDVLDVLYKSNMRNMKIVREHLAAEARRGVNDAEYRIVERAR